MTCNTRYSAAEDGENNWAHRKAFCFDVIRSRKPDIICFQEVMRDQLLDLQAAFPEFDSFGMAKAVVDEHVPNVIFYRRDMFARVSTGGYWLSKTPHVPGSSSWESADVRLANWIRLEDEASGRECRITNTHLDHISQPARENQARLISKDTRAFPEDYPQILVGDMNCDGRNPAIEILREAGWRDTYEAVHGTDDPGPTLHEFLGPAYVSEIGKMDWIFVRGDVRISGAEIITDSRDGRYPSDHYFVSAQIKV